MADSLDEPYQSLYRRFRPATFAEIRGQDHVVLALRNAVRDGRVAHAYLFSGPRGTGKTTTARVLAKALNCTDLRDGEPCGTCASCVEIAKGTSLDVHELDAASHNGVEAMRDLVARAALGTPGRQKVYIVDEVHMLSTPASNTLLKTLEEPPSHVVFVLATTDPQKVLPTIRSRTQHFEFRLLGPEVLGELLTEVREQAHLAVPDEAIDLAVRRGRGSARDALSVLDQVAASETVDDDLPELDEVVEALAERDAGRALVAVAHLTGSGFGPQQLAGDLVDHLRQRFLTLVAPDLVSVSGTEREAGRAQAERVGLATLVRAMEELGLAQVAMRDAPDPRVNLEVALVRLTHPEADDSPAALLARIERLEAKDRAGEEGGRPLARSAPSPSRPGASAAAAPGSGAAATGVDRPALGALRGRGGGPTGRATSGQTGMAGAAGGDAGQEPAAQARPGSTVEDGDREDRPGGAQPEGRQRAGVAPTGDSSPFPSRDELVQAWGDHVISALRPKAKALFQAGRFVGVDDGRAVYGLPNETHRVRCEGMRDEVESALSDHFGRPVPLLLVVEPGADAGLGPPASKDRLAAASTAADVGGAGRDPGGLASGTPIRPDDDEGDAAYFDESELGEPADIGNLAEARLLEAFPGAEEVR